MSKVTLNNITGGYAAVDLLNENFDAIEAAFDNTLSRNGAVPNTWLANQDANHKRLINLADPIDDKDAANKEYVINAVVDATPIAFAKAAYYVDRFTGDGSDTTFTLTAAPGLGTNSQVYISGAYQNKNTYSVSGTTLTFTEAPPNNSDIEVVVVQPVAPEVNAASNITIADAGDYYSSGYVEGALQEVMERARQTVSVKDFGAVGDGVTDDTAAIQTAMNYAFANKKNVVFPTATYAVSDTLSIPQNFDPTFTGQLSIITIEGGNSVFNLLADVTLFESSNYGTTLDSEYSINIVLQNFSVTYDAGSNLTEPLLKIQDWHQGCVIQNIVSYVNEQMLLSNNNFYTNFANIQSYLQAPAAGNRFVFLNSHNLNKISGLVAANSIVGYKFDGPLTACQMTNMSFEGMEIGAQFDSTVYDLAIENSYFEGITDSFLKFTTYVENCYINNNYFNFLNSATTYLIDYTPVPGLGIYITSSNNYTGMPSNANIIKQKEDVYGTGIVIQRTKTGGTINDLLITNATVGQNVDWQQKIALVGGVGNVINTYVPGNYSGKYSAGISGNTGFTWTNLSSSTIQINTKILYSNTQRIYVNIVVGYGSGSSIAIKGEFIGGFSSTTFYEYGVSGISVTSALTATNVGGFVQIGGTAPGTVTGIEGEIRLI